MPFACDLSDTWNSEPNYNTSDGTIHFPSKSDTPLPQYNTWELLNSKAWDDAKKFTESCVKNNEEIAPFLGTAFVARDMLSIVDALEEDGLLRFWGRSYSTALGATFAAMFPDRVGRMLLDSVLPPWDYWTGSWLTAARGTDDALMNILNECVIAGPEFCPLAYFTGPDTSGESLMTALSEAFQDLADNPIFMDETYENYLPWWRPDRIPLFHEIKNGIFQFIYNPNQVSLVIPMLTAVLSKEWKAFLVPSNSSTPIPEDWSEGAQAYHGIACGDSTFRANEPEDMYTLLRAQRAQGSFNDAFAPQGWVCSQWKFKSAERFEGNFKDINTSFPILFINSPYDPITPLSSAWEVSSAFKGSRLLVHKGHGHGFMNHPSSCSIKAVGEYFKDGVMPAYGTECEPDLNVFETWLAGLEAAQGNQTTNEKRDMDPSMTALYEMSRRDAMNGKAKFGGWM
jgi:pimeloyl-ACP methyl ester carboxylesterase